LITGEYWNLIAKTMLRSWDKHVGYLEANSCGWKYRCILGIGHYRTACN
jgi:hypothetical protein